MKPAGAGVTLVVGATLVLLAGCELIAGIDDRTLGQPDGTGGSPAQSGGGGSGGSVSSDAGFDHPLDAGGNGGAGGTSAGGGGRVDAGNDAPGGMTGTGGRTGTGGATGAGGASGAGGVTSTGGRTGAGGVTGIGGSTGAGGGVSGSGGGAGMGGISGTGGATALPTCDPSVQNNNLCLDPPTCNRLCGLNLTALGVARASGICACLVDGWSCAACTYPTDPALACFHLPASLVACPHDGTALIKTGTSTCTAPDAGSCGAICGSTSVNSYQDSTGTAQVGACACVAGVWQCAPRNDWPP